MRKLAFFGGRGDPLKKRIFPASRSPGLLFPASVVFWPTITVLSLERGPQQRKCRLSAHCGRGLSEVLSECNNRVLLCAVPLYRCGDDGNANAPVANWVAEFPNPEKGWGSGPPRPGWENMGLNGDGSNSSGRLCIAHPSIVTRARLRA